MEPKFKVGDKVRFKLREDIPKNVPLGWDDHMNCLCGKEATISSIYPLTSRVSRVLFRGKL
jgi:hypothetical protein